MTINLQNINKVYTKSSLLDIFDSLFNTNREELQSDKDNIYNFLICDYPEALACFKKKINCLDYIDEVIFLIYDEGNNIIGYCSLFPNRWNTSIYLNELEIGIFIKSTERGKGYGKLTLLQLEEYIKLHYPLVDTLVLAPRIYNSKAIKLYEKLGYDFEPNSLAFSQDMVYMIKQLKIDNYQTQANNEPKLTKIFGDYSRDLMVGNALTSIFQGLNVCTITFWDDNNSAINKTLSYYPNAKNYSVSLNPLESNSTNWVDQTQNTWYLLQKIAPSYDKIYLIDGLDALAFRLIDPSNFLQWLKALPDSTKVYISGTSDKIFENGVLVEGLISDNNLDIGFNKINAVKIN